MVQPVLVVDDEEDVRESTCLLLTAWGYQAIPVADAGDVLPMAIEHQPGLILQDLRMPNMNLAGIVAALRSEPATQHIPLVFFSANADVAATARRYDAWGYLRKPFAPAALQQVVDNAYGNGPTGDLQKQIRDAFHEQWNVVAALANYAHALQVQSQDTPMGATAEKLQGQLLRLEATIDRLHTFVSKVADGQDPAPARPARPERPRRAPALPDA